MYRLLAIDVDGTLLNSRHEITAATRAALRRADSAGVRVVLATGRRYSRALPLIKQLELDNPLVTASGALVKHPSDHVTLYRADFARDVLCRMLGLIAAAGFETLLHGDTFHEGYDFYCARVQVEQAELAEYLAKNPDSHCLWPQMMHDPPQGIFAGFAMGTRGQMLELHHRLQKEMPGLLHTHVLRSPHYHGFMCEIAPHGVTKWTSVLRLADAWGIRAEEICAAGDDVNDLAMIAEAGLGVAMGNAQEEVKAAADRIAPSHDDDGLVQVVDWLLD